MRIGLVLQFAGFFALYMIGLWITCTLAGVEFRPRAFDWVACTVISGGYTYARRKTPPTDSTQR